MLISFPSEGSWSPALRSLLAACLLLGGLLVLLPVSPGSDHLRTDTAPGQESRGRSLQGAVLLAPSSHGSGCVCLQPRLEQSSLQGVWALARTGGSVRAEGASSESSLANW